MTDIPAFGIYEELHHLRLEEILRRHPELRSVFGEVIMVRWNARPVSAR